MLYFFMKCRCVRQLPDRVSVPLPSAVDILLAHNGKGQSSLVLVFCVNPEWHISALLSNYTCPFDLIVCETNYNMNIFRKQFQILQ